MFMGVQRLVNLFPEVSFGQKTRETLVTIVVFLSEKTRGHFRSHSNAIRLNENVQGQQETTMGWPLLFSSSLPVRRNRRLF